MKTPPTHLRVTDGTGALAASDVAWLRRNLRRVAAHAGLVDARVGVVVVDDKEMASLHKAYRGVNGTTDVLTFDLSDDLKSQISNLKPVEGEIYTCLDEARRRAAELGHDTRHELLLYALHGLLHLMGYDDHKPADYKRMHGKEDELLSAIGVGAVFGRAAGGRP